MLSSSSNSAVIVVSSASRRPRAGSPWLDPALAAALAGGLALEGLMVGWSPLRSVLGTVPLGAGDVLRVALASAAAFALIEAAPRGRNVA